MDDSPTEYADMMALEEIQNLAWPPKSIVYLDGWELRFNSGYSNRPNSVNPFRHGGAMPLDEKIAVCEQAYASQGLPTIFRAAPWARPEGLVEALLSRGFRFSYAAHVMTRDIHPDDFAEPVFVLPDGSLDDYMAAHEESVGRSDDEMRAMLRRVTGEQAYALAREGDCVAARGHAVLERGWVGLFGIFTDEAFRRRGLARRVCEDILSWGARHGADRGYLQVVADNAPARALYESLGFKMLYSYEYYRKDTPRERPSLAKPGAFK